MFVQLFCCHKGLMANLAFQAGLIQGHRGVLTSSMYQKHAKLCPDCALVHVCENCMAKSTWHFLTIEACELLPCGSSIWPILRMQELQVGVQVLRTSQELVTKAAPGGQIFTGRGFPLHMMPIARGHNREDSGAPLLTAYVLQRRISQQGASLWSIQNRWWHRGLCRAWHWQMVRCRHPALLWSNLYGLATALNVAMEGSPGSKFLETVFTLGKTIYHEMSRVNMVTPIHSISMDCGAMAPEGCNCRRSKLTLQTLVNRLW